MTFSIFFCRSRSWLCGVLQLELLKEPSTFVQSFPGENCAHCVLPSSALSQRYQGADSAAAAAAADKIRMTGTAGLVFILRPPWRDVERTPVMRVLVSANLSSRTLADKGKLHISPCVVGRLLLIPGTKQEKSGQNITPEFRSRWPPRRSGRPGLVQNAVADAVNRVT